MSSDTDALQQIYYDFHYDDEDTMMNELDEFFSNMEASQFDENLRAWEGSFLGGWHQLYAFFSQSLNTNTRMDQKFIRQT